MAQLETQFVQGSLSLQRLWFYVQPIMGTMQTCAALRAAASEEGFQSGG